MPPASQQHHLAVDHALRNWRQGDVCLDPGLEFIHAADLCNPGSNAARNAGEQLAQQGEQLSAGLISLIDAVPGFVVLTQTCDIVRPSIKRPFVEISPLISVPADFVEEVRRLRRPAFAYIPATADLRLVADLDRVMTIEKAAMATWRRIPGCRTDDQVRAFAGALARNRVRFAFPDDFVAITGKLQEHLRKRHGRQHAEGAHLRALREIRVSAAPAWDADQVSLGLWFIKNEDALGVISDWSNWVDKWTALLNQPGRFQIQFALACRLEDLTARDYVESDPLDLDSLSAPASC